MPDFSPRFILVGTSHAGNVGSAARALKVMGFSDLVLVAPRFANVQKNAEAIALASGANDVLSAARVAATLPDALDGITYAAATAMTPRDFGPSNHAPRELFASIAASPHRVAFVFGSERYGLANDDVYACHACVTIPTDPSYGSLNLAQAIQVVAYEWRQAIGGFATTDAAHARSDISLADTVAVRGLIDHWRDALVSLGFLDLSAPKKLLPRLQRLANRVGLTSEEVHILRGIARAIEAQSEARNDKRR